MAASNHYFGWEKTTFLFVLLFLQLFSNAQDKDSLLKVIPTVQEEKERIRLAYLVIGESGDNDPEKALLYYKKALQVSRQMNDKVLESVVTAEMGYAFYFMGNTVKGTETILQALRLAEKENSQQAIGIAYNNLNLAYDDPIKQREVLFDALAASTAAKDYMTMCWELGNLAYVYVALKQPDSASYYVQREFDLAMSQKIEQTIPASLTHMGYMAYNRGQKAVALAYFHSAEREPYTAKDVQTARTVYLALSNYFRKENNPDSCLYYAQKGYAVAKNAFYSIQLPALASLSSAYELNKQSDSALKYMKQYLEMNDSLNNKAKRVLVEYQLVAEEERQQVLNEERKNYLQYSAVAIGIVVLLVAFFLFSHSVIANQKLVRFLGVLSLLIVFEFLNLLLHPFLEKLTHHQTFFMLAVMVGIAALLVPIHHKLEHWVTHQLVEKNKKIRLEAAKKTIAQLERRTETNSVRKNTDAQQQL
jgi:hypothetical protein